MTEIEKTEIINAVIDALNDNSTNYDDKVVEPYADDVILIMRKDGDARVGKCVTWEGLCDTITASAKNYAEASGQSATTAEEAKNAANNILEQVQSKGTEITNFVATSKTEIETQKNESVNAVKSVYQTDLDELKGDLNQIATFEQRQYEIIYHKADLQTTYDSTYVNEGSISDIGKFSASTSYRTYYLKVTKAMDVWIENNPASTDYLGIAIYNNTVSQSNFVGRYRNNDENLPTENNRLTVTTGQWLAITFSYYSGKDKDFNLYTGLYNSVSTNPVPTNDFMGAINERIVLPYDAVGKATKTATALTITMGKLKYEVNKYSNSTIRAYVWRTNACMVLDNNGVYQTIWVDSDSDGVVKISGESDFIGGCHGDETETLFKLFVDGVEYTESETFENLSFNEIVLYFESDVYHCNTSETPDVVAFKRNKIIKFNNEGYTVENYWTAQEDLTCEISYIGMLSVENGLINGYSTNGDFKYHALDNGVARSANITEVCFMTPYGDIGIKVSDTIPSENYGTGVSAYTGRLKVYASNFNSSAYGSLSAGDVIKGKAVIWFK